METFGEDGGVEKMSKLCGESQKNPNARLKDSEEHWTTLRTHQGTWGSIIKKKKVETYIKRQNKFQLKWMFFYHK